MTYKENFEELRNAFAVASDKYLKKQEELGEVNGFFDGKLIEDAYKLKKEWQDAANEFHSFLDYVKKNNINPNDEIMK